MSEILKLLFKDQSFYLTQAFGSTKGTDYPIVGVDFHNGEDYSMDPKGKAVLNAYAIADGEITANGRTDYRGYYIDIFYPLYNKTMRLMHSDKPSPLGNVGIGVTGYHHHVGWFSGKAGSESYEAFSKQTVEEDNVLPTFDSTQPFTFNTSVRVRTSTDLRNLSNVRAQYNPAETLNNIIETLVANGYIWAKYKSDSGVISYVAIYYIAGKEWYGSFGKSEQPSKPDSNVGKTWKTRALSKTNPMTLFIKSTGNNAYGSGSTTSRTYTILAEENGRIQIQNKNFDSKENKVWVNLSEGKVS